MPVEVARCYRTEWESDRRVVRHFQRYEELLELDPESGTPEGDELERLTRVMDESVEGEAYAD